MSLQIVATVIVFGSCELLDSKLNRLGGGAGLGAALLAVAIFLSCMAPAWLYARVRRARDAAWYSTPVAHRLSLGVVSMHVVLVLSWVLLLSGLSGAPGLLLVAMLVVVPSAIVAYGATRVGLSLGGGAAKR